MSVLAVSLFGAPGVTRDGVAVPFARRKTLALLAYLAVSGRAHNRDALAALEASGRATEEALTAAGEAGVGDAQEAPGEQ